MTSRYSAFVKLITLVSEFMLPASMVNMPLDTDTLVWFSVHKQNGGRQVASFVAWCPVYTVYSRSPMFLVPVIRLPELSFSTP